MWGYTSDKIVIPGMEILEQAPQEHWGSWTDDSETEAERQRRLHHERMPRDDGTRDEYDPSAMEPIPWTYIGPPDTDWTKSPEWLLTHQDPEYDRDRTDRDDVRERDERDRYKNPYDEPEGPHPEYPMDWDQWARD